MSDKVDATAKPVLAFCQAVRLFLSFGLEFKQREYCVQGQHF